MKLRVLAVFGAIGLLGATLLVVGPLAANANASCAAIQFIGVRGSGEPAGFGGTVGAALTAFKNDETASVGSYAVVYPATHIPIITDATPLQFAQSVNAGVSALMSHLNSESAECPNQKFVVSGYSQGALVVDIALAQEPSSILSRVKGTVLFGDPFFDSSEPYDAGTYSSSRNGLVRDALPAIANGYMLPPSLSAMTQSYCIAGDPICNYGFVNLVTCLAHESHGQCAHQLYVADGYANKAAAFLASKA